MLWEDRCFRWTPSCNSYDLKFHQIFFYVISSITGTLALFIIRSGSGKRSDLTPLPVFILTARDPLDSQRATLLESIPPSIYFHFNTVFAVYLLWQRFMALEIFVSGEANGAQADLYHSIARFPEISLFLERNRLGHVGLAR